MLSLAGEPVLALPRLSVTGPTLISHIVHPGLFEADGVKSLHQGEDRMKTHGAWLCPG
jgi:hypothetical protein